MLGYCWVCDVCDKIEVSNLKIMFSEVNFFPKYVTKLIFYVLLKNEKNTNIFGSGGERANRIICGVSL